MCVERAHELTWCVTLNSHVTAGSRTHIHQSQSVFRIQHQSSAPFGDFSLYDVLHATLPQVIH